MVRLRAVASARRERGLSGGWVVTGAQVSAGTHQAPGDTVRWESRSLAFPHGPSATIVVSLGREHPWDCRIGPGSGEAHGGPCQPHREDTGSTAALSIIASVPKAEDSGSKGRRSCLLGHGGLQCRLLIRSFYNLQAKLNMAHRCFKV